MASSAGMIRHRRKPSDTMDRFIPNCDLDYAHYVVTGGTKWKENNPGTSVSSEAYQKMLFEVFNMNRRIFSFNKPGVPIKPIPSSTLSAKRLKPQRVIPKSYESSLEAEDIIDDYSYNLLDWGPNNLFAIALDCTVYLYDALDRSTWELCTVVEEDGPVTSVSWASDGQHIAIGLKNSHVQLWDSLSTKQVRTLSGGSTRVGSMAWSSGILSTGDNKGRIINHDTRMNSHAVDTYRGHKLEVCGLRWSPSGRHLASGGNDSLVVLWDRSASGSGSDRLASGPGLGRSLHRFRDHVAAVRALAWCPFQSNLLATGGGERDGCIKFWNSSTGECLSSVNTGSEVCGLVWSKRDRELLSSQGCDQNQLVLWKYPSMLKIAELGGHESRPLYMAQSPDGRTVASAAGDKTLRLWNVFGAQEVAKPSPKPFAGIR